MNVDRVGHNNFKACRSVTSYFGRSCIRFYDSVEGMISDKTQKVDLGK